MKHNIRINGEIQTLDCELGSGIFDKNGREIFEGDKVRDDTGKIFTTRINGSAFDFENNDKCISADMYNGSVAVISPKAWSRRKHDAYNALLDTFIARKNPDEVCAAAKKLAAVCILENCDD